MPLPRYKNAARKIGAILSPSKNLAMGALAPKNSAAPRKGITTTPTPVAARITKILFHLIVQGTLAQKRLIRRLGKRSMVLLTSLNIFFHKLGIWLSNYGQMPLIFTKKEAESKKKLKGLMRIVNG